MLNIINIFGVDSKLNLVCLFLTVIVFLQNNDTQHNDYPIKAHFYIQQKDTQHNDTRNYDT